MADLQARVIITAVDNVSKQLGGIASKFGGFGKKMARAGTGMAAAGAAIAAPVIAAGGAAVAATIDFEKAMLEWKKASDALETTEGWDKAHEAISRLSRELPQSHTELAQMATQASKAGVKFEEFEGFVRMSAQAASAFDIEAKAAGEMLAGIKEGLALTNDQMQLHLGQMDLLENKYKTTGAHLADYLQQEYASVKKYGVSIQEYLSIATVMEATGIKSEKIARAMRAVGQELGAGINATKKQRMAWKAMNMDAEQVARTMQEDGGIIKVLTKMKEGLDNLPAEEQGPVIRAIVGKMGSAALTNVIDKLHMVNDALKLTSDEAAAMAQLKKSFDIGMEGLGAQLDMLKNSFGEIIIQVGRAFLPITKRAVAYVKSLTEALAENPEAMKWLVTGLVAIAGVGTGLMVAGAALTLMGTAISAIAAVASIPVLVTLGPAILAIVAAFKHWDVVGPAWWDMIDAAKELWEAVKPLGSAIMEVVRAVGEMLGYNMEELTSEWEPLRDIAKGIAEVFKQLANSIRAVRKIIEDPLSLASWKELLGFDVVKGSLLDKALNWAGVEHSTVDKAGVFKPGTKNLSSLPSFDEFQGKASVAKQNKSWWQNWAAEKRAGASDGAISAIPKNSPLLKDGPLDVQGAVSLKDDVPVKVDGEIQANFTVKAEPGTEITQQGVTAAGRNVRATTNSPGVNRTGLSNNDIPTGP